MSNHRRNSYSHVEYNHHEVASRKDLADWLLSVVWLCVRLGAAILFLGLIIWGVMLGYERLAQDERLRLEGIDVRPTLHYGDFNELDAQIRAHLQAQGSPNIINVDVQLLAQELEKISWLRKVQVRKHSLRRLLVEVEERVPIVRWGEHELLDAEGVRFQVAMSDELAKLFQLYGNAGRERMVLQYAEVIKPWLDEQGIAVSALGLDSDKRWYLLLNEKVKVILGQRDLEKRLKRFSLAYHSRLKSLLPLIEELNMAHPTGVVISFKKNVVPMAVPQKRFEPARK